jgi:hypothetical protein
MLRPRPTDPRVVLGKVRAHYEELAQKFNDGSLTRDWFEAKYRPSAILHHKAGAKIHQGPAEINDFWIKLRDSGVTSISFNFPESSLPKLYQVDAKAKHIPVLNKQHDYVEMAALTVSLEFRKTQEAADPEFDILWGHWDVCEWYPEGEVLG